MTGLLQGLETDGFIKRTASADDKRMSYVALTAKGRRYVDNILPDLFRRLGFLMDGVTDKEGRSMVKLLEKVRERIPALTGRNGEVPREPKRATRAATMGSAGRAHAL